VNVDSNRKNKGLVSYNTWYGTIALKKHVTDKHVEEYRRWGLFVVQKSKDGGNQRQSLLLKSQTFSTTNDLTTNLIMHNKHYWKIWYCTSQKIIDHCLLLKTHG
jgi:hypothetical protein